MKDAATIVIVHISRQRGQPVLDVGQDLRLKAEAASDSVAQTRAKAITKIG